MSISIFRSSGGSNELFQKIVDRSITEVTTSDLQGVTSIGDSAFYHCRSLTSITIPDSVTSIGNNVFWSCEMLTSATISNSVTSIGTDAFRNCYELRNVNIPNNLTSIAEGVFRACNHLTTVTIPDGVTSIGAYAFYNCARLTSITILATTPPTLANSNAFNNTNNCPIYVPAESVDAYKAATNWSSLASRIQAIP